MLTYLQRERCGRCRGVLRMFEQRKLRTIFISKRDEVMGVRK
jgi:cytidine deaminase